MQSFLYPSFFISSIFYVTLLSVIDIVYPSTDLVDQHPACKEWSDAGECENNPGYMLENCKKSCHEALSSQEDTSHIESFYDLEAEDIDYNTVDFDNFRGKVVLLVNVASFCGYTESHYAGLIEVYSTFGGTEEFEILAFPCNQFGHQEPEKCPVIKRFAESKGVKFRMMNKIDVNGPKTHTVYKYLKSQAGQNGILILYYLVDQNGNLESYTDVHPHDLIPYIDEMMSDEL
eukprot:CAMPEP_0113329542 /NCGR_PEP_ID=MMETSP0010_2-20120614/20966_1 /TAXON_ID=216773 ORGANISM="Corethron hystrix, Strain 308" /NCGR_SAMPLE_ID=MMETSP0010_2 /ASSEMBLY_ACC=CAM_ASM_000155 /LENGTH=231 /DNA_ID=CAMNT_0000191659 /DNA_START=68 /DNA_END=762 /DNA_ORIENTATION=+ /assembly_acc=CAM_ASM_000155